ncbi:MazG nucleotide pyrophosphohydrolase domain-containing protein [Kocuria sp. KSNUG]
MDRLRSPGGCPWDAEQTHESLLRYLVEEAYEVVEAVETLEPSSRRDELVEELGDVLLQVVFHARIGQEHPDAQRFDVSDVISAVTDKLVRRHPAVFGASTGTAPATTGDTVPGAERAGGPAVSSDEVPAAGQRPSTAELAARWDAVKRGEKPQRTRIFDGIPPALPALARAEKALSKARRHGVPGVVAVGPELPEEQREDEERELGERLLRQVAQASARGLDPERALRTAVGRFVRENDGPLPG